MSVYRIDGRTARDRRTARHILTGLNYVLQDDYVTIPAAELEAVAEAVHPHGSLIVVVETTPRGGYRRPDAQAWVIDDGARHTALVIPRMPGFRRRPWTALPLPADIPPVARLHLDGDIRPVWWRDYRGGASMAATLPAPREVRIDGPAPTIFDAGILPHDPALRTAAEGALAMHRAAKRDVQVAADDLLGQTAIDVAAREAKARTARIAAERARDESHRQSGVRAQLAPVARLAGIDMTHGDPKSRGAWYTLRDLGHRL